MERKTIGVGEMTKRLGSWPSLDAPFYFSNSKMTMLGTGEQSRFNKALPFTALAGEVSKWMEANKQHATDNPIAFGVIPFHESEDVNFVIPKVTEISANIRSAGITAVGRQGNVRSVRPAPREADYKRAVQSSVAQIQTGTLEKVVLARALELEFDEDWSAEQLLIPLIKQNPLAFNFSVPMIVEGKRHWLIGSSPELLVRRQGRSLAANPLAGSRRRSESSDENLRLSDSLLGSDKDLNEHALVVDAIEQSLQGFSDNLHVPFLPSVISTPTMLHLSTMIEGTLNNSATRVLDLVSALHPTPAVCGQPLVAARQFIDMCEPFQRGYFTGLVGWCDSRGNGEWAIAIRCGLMHARGLTAYAGAGIVAQSNPEDELQETASKMRTILQAAQVPVESAFFRSALAEAEESLP